MSGNGLWLPNNIFIEISWPKSGLLKQYNKQVNQKSGNLEYLMNKLLVLKRKLGIFGIFFTSIKDKSISES